MKIEKLQNIVKNYKVILEPDENKKDWWAGAPSVVYTEKNEFFLAARMREANSPRGRRGYEIRILKSKDGENFQTIKKIHRDDANVMVFERAALVQNPKTKLFRLYGCSSFGQGWAIWKLDDVEDPKDFDPSSLKKVLTPDITTKNKIPSGTTNIDASHHQYVEIQGYKDPFIFWEKNTNDDKGKWHMFVIGYDKVERPYHFISTDDKGEKWHPLTDKTIPFLESTGWHNFFTRPGCILPLGIGYLCVYEGSNVLDFDPVYNISSGLAFSLDLEKFLDLTPDKPIFQSSTPCAYNTWRYSHFVKVENQIYAYFESCKENQSNEIRLAKIPLNYL